VTAIYGYKLRQEYLIKKELNYPFVEGDVLWNTKNTILYPGLSIVAGLAAGFLGVGGGMIAGPLMLEMGILPQVAAVTSSYFILFTSSSTTTQFLFLGRLEWRYALWYCVIGFLGAVVGQLGLGYVLKKYKKQWMVAALVAFTILISTIILVFINIEQILAGEESGSLKFHKLCGA